MPRVYNFSAGPATLPLPVLEQVQSELLDWQGTGASVMELSHRGKEFRELGQSSTQDLRELLNVPENYKILFLPAGGRGQFSMVPMNLLNGKKQAGYVHTGSWSVIASKEAERYCKVKVIADSEDTRYSTIPPESDWDSYNDCAYVYTVDNETINGSEYNFVPNTGDVPLISDMSSNFLSRSFDVSRYGLVFACAQKNVGPAGITIVIIREDLLELEPLPDTPCMFRYLLHAENDSLFNTPPTFPWYVSSLVFKWIKSEGGLGEMEKRNARKSKKLYDYIDASDFYENPVAHECRSRMNVVFTCVDREREMEFVEHAAQAGMIGLKGHRFLGGMRASLYNPMPEAGVDRLIEFMDDFAKRNA